MKRFLLLIVALWLLAAGPAQAVWFELTSPEPASPEFRVDRADRDGVDLRVTLPGFEFAEPHAGYVALELPGESHRGVIGEPAVPTITRLIRAPFGAAATVETEAVYESLPIASLTGALRLMPAQPSLPKQPGAAARAAFVVDENAYRGAAPIFRETAAVADAGLLRCYRLMSVELHPFNYAPATGRLQIAKEIRVRIRFQHPDWAETNYQEQRYAEPRTYAIARNIAVNFEGFAQADGEPHFAPSSYVIIGNADALNLPQVQDFIAWKTQRGYDVVAATLADAGGYDPLKIRSYLQDAYTSWERPPAYVLLLGDTNVVPFFTGVTSPNPATDVYYGAMTNTSYIPALGIGRLSYGQTSELVNMLNKILAYEKNQWSDAKWTKHATFMASDDNYTVSEGTHNWVCDQILTPDGFTCTKVYNHEGATTAQALAALDTGPTIHAYSGHGSEYSWADGPPVDQDQVRTLTNTTTPLVLSHACLTGSYQLDECFAETFVRIPHGALAFWGASESTFWDEDDILERGEFTGWFKGDNVVSSLPWTKGLLDFGLMSVYTHYNGGGNTRHYFEMYNLFGDPETMLYSAPPATIAPTYDATISPDAMSLDVTVANHPNAMVGVVFAGHLLGVGYAGANGNARVALNRALTDKTSLTLTVTGENLAPYIGTIRVAAAAADDDNDDATADDDDDSSRASSDNSGSGGGCGG